MRKGDTARATGTIHGGYGPDSAGGQGAPPGLGAALPKTRGTRSRWGHTGRGDRGWGCASGRRCCGQQSHAVEAAVPAPAGAQRADSPSGVAAHTRGRGLGPRGAQCAVRSVGRPGPRRGPPFLRTTEPRCGGDRRCTRVGSRPRRAGGVAAHTRLGGDATTRCAVTVRGGRPRWSYSPTRRSGRRPGRRVGLPVRRAVPSTRRAELAARGRCAHRTGLCLGTRRAQSSAWRDAPLVRRPK